MDHPVIDAVVTAGGVPQPGDPLYPLTQGQSKALLPIGGRPMVQWVLDALSGARTVRRAVVVGLTPEQAPLTYARPLGQLPNQGSMIANLEAGTRWVLEQDPAAGFILAVSSDVPTVQPPMVDWMVTQCLQSDHDAYYAVIPAALVEQRFPGSRRSFFKLKDGRFTGSDINVFKTSLISRLHPAWRGIVEARKNVLKQASLIGFGTLLLMALGRMSIAEAERRAGRRLGLRGRGLVCPYPEMGMDVDKPHQYEMLKRELEARVAAA